MSTPPPIPVIPLVDGIVCHPCGIVTVRQSDGRCPICGSLATINVVTKFPVVECEARLVEGEKKA